MIICCYYFFFCSHFFQKNTQIYCSFYFPFSVDSPPLNTLHLSFLSLEPSQSQLQQLPNGEFDENGEAFEGSDAENVPFEENEEEYDDQQDVQHVNKKLRVE